MADAGDHKKAKAKAEAADATRRVPLDDFKKEEMLAVLIRNQDAYEAVCDLFKPDHCRRGLGEALGVVWKYVRKFYIEYGELPGRTQLESELSFAAKGNKSLLGADERQAVDKFLDFAWDDAAHGRNLGKSRTAMRVAVATCRGVLEELSATALQSQLFAEGTLPVDLPAILADAKTRLDLVQSIGDVTVEDPFPEGWDKRSETQITPTGVEPLDSLTGGGLMAGECLLFMAPYGSCKTATACASSAAMVAYAHELYQSGNSRRDAAGEPMTPVVVLVFTESDKDEYRNRLMAHMARVPWKTLRHMTSLNDLDGGKKPGAKDATKYELAEFADAIAADKENLAWRNERTRVKNAAALANKHLMLIDCTDDEGNQHRVGAGGMPEVANVVRGVFRKKKTHYPIMVWVDHLSGLLDRMTFADDKVKHATLSNMPRVAVERIGRYFKCPVGLMHQFAGAFQKANPTVKLHHSDAEGSKSIGKYANFCVVSGKTDEHMMCLWEATKHRREPPTAQRIVRVAGDFSRIVDCTKTHGVEPGRKVIMSKKELETASSLDKAKAGNFADQTTY